MSKEIVRVEGSASRDMHQTGSGSFYSTHKPEVIEKWLRQTCADDETRRFNEVFGTESDWWDEDHTDILDDFDVSFTEEEGEDECEFDEEIQQFIDEEPKRLRDAGINQIGHKFEDLKVHLYDMQETARQLLVDLEKVVKTDDVKKLPENSTERKIYRLLKKLTSV